MFECVLLDILVSHHGEMTRKMGQWPPVINFLALQLRLCVLPFQDDDPHQRLVVEAIKDDKLRAIEKEEKTVAEYSILTAAKLIALVVEPNFSIGFDW